MTKIPRKGPKSRMEKQTNKQKKQQQQQQQNNTTYQQNKSGLKNENIDSTEDSENHQKWKT